MVNESGCFRWVCVCVRIHYIRTEAVASTVIPVSNTIIERNDGLASTVWNSQLKAQTKNDRKKKNCAKATAEKKTQSSSMHT